MQRNILVNWLNQNPQSWVRTSGNINLPNNPLGKLDATKHNLTEIKTPPLEKTPLPTQSTTLPKSAMKRFFKSRLAYEEGSEAGAGTLAETPAQSRFLWFRPNDGENLLKIGTEDTLKELAEVWKKQRREQDKANAEAKRLEQEKKEKSLRSSQFGAVMEIAKQNNGDLSWMDNVNTKIANEYFPDLYKNKEDFQNLKHNLQLLLVGDIEYGEFLAGYAENKPWYIDDGYTKEEKQWLKQGGWRAQTQQQKPLSWGAWDVVDTINLPGKWMEMIDDRAQKIPTAKSFFNIEEREKALEERINALSEEERWRLEDKFKNSPTIQKLYGNVDNYIKATQRSFVDELLDIGYENVWPNLWKMLANAPWSAIKTATAIWRGLTNPADTIAGLGQAVFTEEGRNALKERYIDNLAQTIEEDPVGLASDALTVAELGAKGLASGLKVSGLTKNAKIWALSQKVANFGKTAGEVADLGLGRVYGKGIDALTNIQHNNSSNILKAGAVALRATQEPLKVIGEWLHTGVDKLIGLDKRTKQALENNPFVWKYFERTKQYIEENGLSPESKKEINTEHIKGLSNEILDLINSKKDTLRDTGELYEKIKNANVEFDNQGVKEKLNTYLEDHGIKIKDWKLDFSDSVIVKEWDMRAIEKVYDWATRESYEAKVGLNQRKKMDKVAYPDGAPSAGTEIIKGMRSIFDENMKEKVPGLKEADKLYSEKIKELEQIEDGLIYKQGDRKGQLRDNFEQIVNTLDWPNRARMLQRLDELRPGLWDEIRAVHMMGKLTDMYFKTPTKLSDYFTNAIGLVWGWLLGSRYGIGGMIAGAIGGWLVKQGATKLSQRAIRKAIDNVAPSSLARLKEIEAKIQAGKGMSPEERILIDQIGEKILQESELLNNGRNKEQALPAPGETAVWEERPKWGNILGDTIARNAKPVSNRGEKFQRAESITHTDNFKKWFGDWEKDSKNASKIVNEKGEPLVMYHGTDADFSIFDKKLIKSSNYGDGFYFTSDIRNAKNYGSKTKAVYLDVKNPLDLTTSANDAEFNKRYGKNNSPYDGYIVRFRNGEKMVVVKDSTQIKSATDNVWTFDSNNPDIRYQKYGVADATEKTITPERAKELKNFRNGRSVEELAKDYGVEISIVDKITTPEGVRAYGKYGDGVITLAEKIKEGTAPHELFHATFDLVDSTKKESILEGVMKEKKLDKVQAEEYLADSFSEYFRTGRMKGEKVIWNVGKPLWKRIYDAVKDFFKQVKDWITGVSKNKNQIKKLFDDILDGEIDKEMLWEILGNKKETGTHRHQQSWPRLVPALNKSSSTTSLAGALERSSSKSITISPENANFYKNNLKQLWGKSHQYSPEIFLRDLKNSFGVEGNSSYIANNLSDWTHTLRISNHSAKAWNNKLRGHPENNTSIVIKLADTKFKRNKSVDLVEFVYNPENLTPEKMQGIIKGIQDWIDTGEYTDKNYDLTHKSIRASLEGWEIKYQLAYHGSPYEFDKFDSAHMGKGAGSQAHGWGHYVSIDKDIWKAYADPMQTPGENLRFKWIKGSLYEVEVPDPVKADTPTKSNYLYESRKLNGDELKQFYEHLKTNKRGNTAIFKEWIDAGHIGDGEDLYSALSYVLGWDKSASLFLRWIGYDGVSYYDVWDWHAYVIFDDNKLEIKKHLKDGVEIKRK